jgi:hypothetical protein
MGCVHLLQKGRTQKQVQAGPDVSHQRYLSLMDGKGEVMHCLAAPSPHHHPVSGGGRAAAVAVGSIRRANGTGAAVQGGACYSV